MFGIPMQVSNWLRQLKHWSVSLLGLILLGAAGGHILTDDNRVLTNTIEVMLPIAVAIGLGIGGIWLKRTHSVDRTLQLTKWTAAGALVGHAINLWFEIIISLEHTPVGEPVPLGLNGAAVLMSAGIVLGYYYTGLEAREQSLECPDARFHALTENATFGVVTIDGSSTIRYANDAVEALFGYAAEELVDEPLTALMPDSLEHQHLDGLASYLEDGERRIDWDGVELAGKHANGETFPIEISFGEYAVDNDHLFTGVIRDISERKAAEAQLQKHTDRITKLHQIATDIMSAETSDGVYQRTVDGADELLSCDVARIAVADRGQLVPKASSIDESLVDCEPMQTTSSYAGQCFQSGEPVVIDDLTFTRSTSTAREASSDSGLGSEQSGPSSPILCDDYPTEPQTTKYRSLLSIPLDEFGVIQLFAVEANAFDTDEVDAATLLASHASTAVSRARAEATLRRERDRLDEFASVVSHDIQNPLSVAAGNLELAADECDSEFLDNAATALTRIEYLTEDLLTLARSGKAVGETTPVQLQTIAKSAWGNVETATATLDLSTEDTTVEADRDRLEEAFENLFRNAIEHGGEDVTVRVGALNNGFYVEDTGDGIPDAARDQVFDHGYSTGEGGTGFGLSIVRSIIEGHGWSITTTDASAGGARFEITDVQLSS
ncbi:hypothetical protein C5B86_19230 [Haloferax sp. Atlit-19N]|nr:hypothetical protein C5B86_19230 [Haloferax sp. Atlit-19N]